jgi:hypothetical protein
VVDHIQTEFANDKVAIACIYCNYKDQSEQTVSELIATVLKQLAQDQPELSDNVKFLYTRHIRKHTRPTLEEFVEALQLEIKAFTKVFIVVDALDEFLERDQGYLISRLQSLADTVNLMVTSRPLSLIEQIFHDVKRLHIRPSDDDVRRYIEGRFLREPRLMLLAKTDKNLQEFVVNKITANVQGMYVFSVNIISILHHV